MNKVNEKPESDDTSQWVYMLKFAYTMTLALVIGFGYFYREAVLAWFESPTLSFFKEEEKAAQPQEEPGKKERKIKFWRAPMNPSFTSDKPGKSPMGMELVPVYEEEGEEANIIKINPAVVQNIGVRTAIAWRGDLRKTIRTVGVIDYDETRLAKVQTKVEGWIEKLYIDATGLDVKRGTILLEIYSPELVSTQEEFILALEYHNKLKKSGEVSITEGGELVLESARRRLELFDVPEHQIQELAKSLKVKKTLHIHSVADGVVVKKNIIEGMYVKPGVTLYEIADLSVVWVYVDVYEFEAPYVEEGQHAVLTLTSLPGREFKGHITYIYPFLNRKTRTITVRLEFANSENIELKPGMYGDVLIHARGVKDVVIIPSEAVIRTGDRAIVIIAKGGGRFEPREVELGVESEGEIAILSNVNEGEKVVTSAQFLIDSESKLREAMSKMTPPTPENKEGADSSKMDQSKMKKGEMDHSKMDQSKMDKGATDHSKMDKPTMDKGEMDHSKMNQSTMDKGAMDHSKMDNSDMDHSRMGQSGQKR